MPDGEDEDVPMRNDGTFVSIHDTVEDGAGDAGTDVPSGDDDEFSREVE